MEALIVILFEALAGPIMALFGAISGLLGCVLSSLITLVMEFVLRPLLRCWQRRASPGRTGGVVGSEKSPVELVAAPELPGAVRGQHERISSRFPVPRWWRWVTMVAAGCAAFVCVALVVINQWFIPDVVRYVLSKQEERTGICMTAETITGNLFSGHFQVRDLNVQRGSPGVGQIDLHVRSLDIEVGVWRVLARPLVIHALTIDGITGRYERGATAASSSRPPSHVSLTLAQDDNGSAHLLPHDVKSKPSFSISALKITNLDVTYSNAKRPSSRPLPVTISTLTVQPLRSEWAVFDILFRAHVVGTIAHQPFTISTSGDDVGRDAQWHIDRLPVEVLADQVGGPFALLTAGTADVHVVDHWRRADDGLVLVMDWSLILHQVRAEVPQSVSHALGLLAKPIVAFINAKGERLPLSFRVEINEDRFHGAASAEAAGLWQVVGDSAAATVAKMLGLETDTVKDIGERSVQEAKRLLERLRKKK